MLNNLIKLLVDTNRLRLDDIEYDESVPIESNPELNELELEYREDLARANAKYQRKIVYMFKSQFEPKISNRFRRKCLWYFPIIHNKDLSNRSQEDASGIIKLDTISYYFDVYDIPYIIPSDIGNLYIDIDEDEYRKNHPIEKLKDPSIKMKKHRSKKWRNGIKSKK